MKWHLLNWTLGPAILGAIFASGGAGPPPAALDAWLDFLRLAEGLAAFCVTWYLIGLMLQIIAHRLNEGRFIWAKVRLGALCMAVQLMLLVGALTVLLAVRQLAVILTGGWPKGGWAAACGAAVAAGVGLLLGLGVARLRLPQRLGLDRASVQGNEK